MATPPNFVASYSVSYTTNTSPKTVSVTTQAGDTLVVYAGAENGGFSSYTAPSGNGVTFTQQQDIHTGGGDTEATIWTGVDTTGGTNWTLQMTFGAAINWGFTCLVFRNVGGIGASNKLVSSVTPSLSLTTTQDNSAVVVFIADWAAVNGSTRTWNTVNGITPTAGNTLERTYAFVSGQWTVYGAYYNDVGVAGVKSLGMSAPTGQAPAVVAVEIQGIAAPSAPPTPPPIPIMTGYTTQQLGGVTTTFTIDPSANLIGSAVADGDWIILVLSSASAYSTTHKPTPGAGWTNLVPFANVGTGTTTFGVWAHQRAAGETTYTWTKTNTEISGFASRMVFVSGAADIANWVTGTFQNRETSVTTVTTIAPSVTTTTVDTLGLLIAEERTLAAETDPQVTCDNFTKQFFDEGTDDHTIFVATKGMATPGPTGPSTITYPNLHAKNGIAGILGIPPATMPAIGGHTTATSNGTSGSFTIDPSVNVVGAAVADGDWILLTLQSSGSTVSTNIPTAGAGWTAIVPFATIGSGVTTFGLWAHRRVTGESTYTWTQTTGSTNSTYSRMIFVSGATDLADWDMGVFQNRATNGTTTTNVGSAVTTTKANSLALLVSPERTTTSETNSQVTCNNFTKQWFENNQDHSLFVASRPMQLAGSTGSVTITYPNPHSENGEAGIMGIPPAVGIPAGWLRL